MLHAYGIRSFLEGCGATGWNLWLQDVITPDGVLLCTVITGQTGNMSDVSFVIKDKFDLLSGVPPTLKEFIKFKQNSENQ